GGAVRGVGGRPAAPGGETVARATAGRGRPMSAGLSDGGDRERRLDAVTAEYLRALGHGAPPDRAEILARHPDLAPELAGFFEDHEHIDRSAESLRRRLDRSEAPGTNAGDDRSECERT